MSQTDGGGPDKAKLEARIDALEKQVEEQASEGGGSVSLSGLLNAGVSRRQALKVLGLGGAAMAVPSAMAQSASAQNAITGIDQLGEQDNRIGTIYAQDIDTDTFTQSTDAISADSISTESATIDGRKTSEGDTTISVPGDFSSVQDAVDAAIALTHYGSTIVDIDASYYAEDIVVPGYLAADRGGPTLGTHVRIAGSTDGSGNPATEVDSISVKGGNGLSDPTIANIFVREDAPKADNHGIQVIGSHNARIKNCAFGSNVTDGIRFYGSGGKVSNCNFDNVDTGVRVKRGTLVTVEGSEGAPNSSVASAVHGIVIKQDSNGVSPGISGITTGYAGFAIDSDPQPDSPSEIDMPSLFKQPTQFDLGFGYPKSVDLSNVTPDFDGQCLRDSGANFADGEYAYADTGSGVWRAFSDPVNNTVSY